MQQIDMVTKAIRYQKIASDNAFTLLSIFQDSSEQMLKTTFESSLLPPQGKEGCLTWTSNCRQATEKLKNFVDKGYEEAERLFKQPVKPAQKAEETPAPAQTQKAATQKAKPKTAARKTTTAKKKTAAAKSATQKTSSEAAAVKATSKPTAQKTEAKVEEQKTSAPKQAAPPKPEAQKPQESKPTQK